MNIIFLLTLLAADPFWQTKPPTQWTDLELTQILTDSPWAQLAKGPSNTTPILAFIATAAPIEQAEKERERRALLKRPKKSPTEDDLLVEEYKAWLEENRTTQLILAIHIPDTKAFADDRDVRKMEEESVMRLGRKKIKMTGHFPPSFTDPYLRIAFPRQPQWTEKYLTFELYLPGVSIPYRTVEFTLREMVVGGKPEL